MKSQLDFTNEQDRIKAFLNLEGECLLEFTKSGFKMCPFALIRIDEYSLTISIMETDKTSAYFGRSAFASDMQFYSIRKEKYSERNNEINFGSSGAFNPDCKESYWRTIHASEILTKWGKACEICNSYCEKFRKLRQTIFEANTPKKIN